MKIILPLPAKPLAAYISAVRSGDYIYTSGQLPIVNGKLISQGKLGEDISLEEGYQAARIAVVNCLAAIKGLIGNLDKIRKIIKITGYVNSGLGFTNQPAVINGASEFLIEVFGEAGRHARSAVGVSELPLGASVEIEMIVELLADN
ncbi:MAG: RidA family protein [Peptococcaceae bacterium]|nr:RidA family protein [Peptococcaceae bacterium]